MKHGLIATFEQGRWQASPAHAHAQALPESAAPTWRQKLVGAGMLIALVVGFVPALAFYTLVFGVDAVVRLLDLSANRVQDTL